MRKSPTNQEVELVFTSEIDVEKAARFIAELVRQGVTFEARNFGTNCKDQPDTFTIVFLGGF